MSKTSILFLFEGPRGEAKIVENLENCFLKKGLNVIKCAYGGDIYQLYNALNTDENEFVDLLSLLKERSTQDKNLQKFNKDFLMSDLKRISQIYIFFDYDGQDTGANAHGILGDDKISELLEYFDNETENGKLFISYPMVESLKDIRDYDNFKDHTVKCKKQNCIYKDENSDECKLCLTEEHYKKQVADYCLVHLSDVTHYDFSTWKSLIVAHLCKMNYIISNTYSFPKEIFSQMDIFVNQKSKFIDKKCPEVSVLSAFPIFILDYYGLDKCREIIEIPIL